MKKLNLKKIKLDANDLLQREQLKTVFGGGYDVGKCEVISTDMCTYGCKEFSILYNQWQCSSCCLA